MEQSAEPARLKSDTLLAFQDYIGQAEAGTKVTAGAETGFLWSDADPRRAEQVRNGDTVAERWSGKRPVQVPDGLIHDWIGCMFIPGMSIGAAITLLQDYDNHKNVYKPEVIESKLIRRTGENFEIYLRLLKKKIRTVVLDTYHEVDYVALDPFRWHVRSRTTRISEVENAGKPDEKVATPDAGHGFLWRLNSYWRCFERDNGVYLECRAVSLTREVPTVLEPILKSIPRLSLIATLEATRRALSGSRPESESRASDIDADQPQFLDPEEADAA